MNPTHFVQWFLISILSLTKNRMFSLILSLNTPENLHPETDVIQKLAIIKIYLKIFQFWISLEIKGRRPIIFCNRPKIYATNYTRSSYSCSRSLTKRTKNFQKIIFKLVSFPVVLSKWCHIKWSFVSYERSESSVLIWGRTNRSFYIHLFIDK